MYYKVLKDGKVIDVLDRLTYLKWQPKHKIMVLCDEDEAQAIMSSDKRDIWHEKSLYNIPVYANYYDTVELVEIDVYEYRQLKLLNCKSISEVIDEYTLLLLQEGVI